MKWYRLRWGGVLCPVAGIQFPQKGEPMKTVACLVVLLVLVGRAGAECSYVLWERLNFIDDEKTSKDLKKKAQKSTTSPDTFKWQPKSTFPGSLFGLNLCLKVMEQGATETKSGWERLFGSRKVGPVSSSVGEMSISAYPEEGGTL